jgi:LEA14-like dessication related protein
MSSVPGVLQLPLRLGLHLLLLLPASGCVERLLDFHVRRLVGVRVTGIDGTGFDLRVRCELENPNQLGARLTRIRFRSYVGRHLLGEGLLQGSVTVRPKSRFTLEVPVRVAYRRLPADLPARVAGGTVLLRTEAVFTAVTKVGSYPMKLTATGRTAIAQALKVAIQGPFSGPAFRITEVRFSGVKLRRSVLALSFQARNLFAFPVRIRRGTYRVYVNDTFFAEGKLTGPLTLAPRSSVTHTVELRPTHGAMGSAMMAMLGGEPQFRLKGTLWIDPIGGVSKLPLDVEADAAVFSE